MKKISIFITLLFFVSLLLFSCTRSISIVNAEIRQEKFNRQAYIYLKTTELQKALADHRTIMLGLKGCGSEETSISFGLADDKDIYEISKNISVLRFNIDGARKIRFNKMCGEIYTTGFGLIGYESDTFVFKI